MQFFESFYSLGYSGIVLVVTFAFVTMMIFHSTGLAKRGWIPKYLFLVVMAAGFVFATNYLASERKIMMDAIRDDGGLKRTQDR